MLNTLSPSWWVWTPSLRHCRGGLGPCKPNDLTKWLNWPLLAGLPRRAYFVGLDMIFVWNVLQVYFWVISSNLILRCTWTYKLSAHLRHNYLTVFAITALEIFRRFQWVFFRVENEWIKMSSKSNGQLSMSEIPNEEDRLLVSSGHNV